jgi:ubiquitin related modifier 1
MDSLKLKVEFGGGLELLFSNKRTHLVTIPSTVPEGDRQGEPVDLNFLIHWLKDQLLKERPELFVEGGTVYVASSLHVYTIG